MKKLMMLIIIAFFTVAAMAQTDADTAVENQEEKAIVPHSCYRMLDGKLMHCMGDKEELQKTNITLKNGTKITTDGDMHFKDGKKSKLESGQCIDSKGDVGNYNKMHIKARDK